ncbi:MAG: transporter [Verrucomicrobiaceae bacterium]|nr:transporter [Verrucomicrobiaceae bacterium]
MSPPDQFSLAPDATPAQGLKVPVKPINAERFKLAALFFMTAHALALWSVTFSKVLKAHGYENIIPYAGNTSVTSALAAIVSPLIVGALADQRYSSERVMRWLCLGSGFFMALLFYAIQQHWHWMIVIGLAQMLALWAMPSFGLSTSLVIARLSNPRQQFGPVRTAATLGWIAAGVIVSCVLHGDSSVSAGYASAFAWVLVIIVTYTLDPVPPPGGKTNRSWSDILGLEAWTLLKNPNHRVVFIGAALFNMPLAAFYQFTPLHLDALGSQNTALNMSIGQIMEVVGLLSLAALLTRFRLKWLFLCGIGFGALRYVLFAMDSLGTLRAGIFMHGILFTLFFMTAQIYLEHRIPASMRSRAQALLSLMMSGFGNFFGSLGCGWWWHICTKGEVTDWHRYWSGLAGVILVIFMWFALSYKGRHRVDGHEDKV